MDPKTNHVPLVIGGIIVLAVIAYGAYAFMQKDSTMPTGEMMQKEGVMINSDVGTENATAPGDLMMKNQETKVEGDAMMKNDGAMMKPGA